MPEIKNRKLSRDRTIATINPVIARKDPQSSDFFHHVYSRNTSDKDSDRVMGPAEPAPLSTSRFYPLFPSRPHKFTSEKWSKTTFAYIRVFSADQGADQGMCYAKKILDFWAVTGQ